MRHTSINDRKIIDILDKMKMTKKKCHDILDLIYKISAILTGLAMAVFAWMQVSINNQLIEDNHALHQPNFKVSFLHWKSTGSYINDHTDVVIRNVGEAPKSLDDFLVETYIQFEYRETRASQAEIYYIPIERYFNWVVPTDSLVGKVALSFNPDPNSSYFYYLDLATIDYNKNHQGYVTVRLRNLTRIQYTDKYQQSHVVYFINEEITTEEDWACIRKESEKLQIYPISIEQLSLAQLFKFCGKDEMSIIDR